MRKLVAIGSFLLLVAGSASGARAGGSTSATSDCLHTQIRPTSIILACADGNWYVKRLHWSSWGIDRAVGHGVFHFNDCTPDCVNGTFHTRQGRIVLSGRRRCRHAHVWVFKRAAITYDRPWRGRVNFTGGLACPIP